MYNTFNGYMQGAQPYGNPYADRLAAMQQSQAMHQRCEVVTVNGENGAQAYPLAPNSSALLLDESQPLVWLVKTDGAGYKTVSAFNITPHEQTQQPTNADLEQRIARLEEIIPDAWRGYTRQQVDAGTKRKAVRDAFLRWHSWESETKKLYEQAYADLHELGEVAAACEVKRLVESVACELERVERQRINLECLDYDLAAICAEQDRLLARYSQNYGVVTA